jgi:predicted ArsR family transcriptional regulator
MAEDFRDINSIAALEDELRRSMYQLIRRSEEPQTREDISSALGISIKLAAFHLDKLVDRGLLKAHYARPKGKAGPGAGRSSKFYELSGTEFQLTVPPRHYDLVGSILVETLKQLDKQKDARIAVRLARTKGREIAEKLKAKVSTKRKRDNPHLEIAKKSLELLGYEPSAQSESEIRLKNCPFHSLARQAPDVVCPINKGLIEGVLINLDVKAKLLTPGPPDGHCCVSVNSRA